VKHASVATVALAALAVWAPAAQQARITFDQAAGVIAALSSSLPAGLRGRPASEIARLWPRWAEQHDRDVRARLERGDEDSLVNFWLYGTSFTSQTPAVARGSSLSMAALEDISRRRLEDLLERVAVPGDDERLQFARRLLSSRNAEPATADGRERARRFLLETRQRMTREFAGAEAALAAARPQGPGALAGANATVFRERGLSSDTSVLSDFGVHTAIETMAKQATLKPGSVRRVAVVGPGLDFTNKADGYDYYPQQTLQPFALVDALRRAGLAAADLRLTTLDINRRVNDHLKNAPARAAMPAGYVVTLPLDGQEKWTSRVLAYWQQWGSAIGTEVAAVAPPSAAGIVKARAVRIQPAVASLINPLDFNIVVDRLTLPDGERFDLIVATNVLVYYDVFEQALAAANIAAMLRPGGVFVTNTAVLPQPPLEVTAAYLRVDQTPERYDEIFWYRRAP
jgi:SAM-dependent methyltransferase